MMRAIRNHKEHQKALADILSLMNKGEANLTKKEKEIVRSMALAIQTYEENIYTIPQPQTLEGMIELRMYEMKLKQKDLSKRLGISETKLSLILSGKQKPDIPFIKKIHSVLNVPAEFILQHI